MEIHTFSIITMYLKLSSTKLRQSCLGLNVLNAAVWWHKQCNLQGLTLQIGLGNTSPISQVCQQSSTATLPPGKYMSQFEFLIYAHHTWWGSQVSFRWVVIPMMMCFSWWQICKVISVISKMTTAHLWYGDVVLFLTQTLPKDRYICFHRWIWNATKTHFSS